jgi:hypothetical protein
VPGRDKSFSSAINRHGFPFQNAVLRRAKELFKEGHSTWAFEAAEFPVEVAGAGTRIDFVLSSENVWLLAECKRADPSLCDWVFLRAPLVRRNHHERFVVDRVNIREHLGFSTGPISLLSLHSRPFAHRGFEVKTSDKGEGAAGRSAIEEATSQLFRGVNGMINCLQSKPAMVGDGNDCLLLPVLFTTAKLYVSDLDMSQTDLLSGKLNAELLKPQEVPYVYYQYHLSPGIKHPFPTSPSAERLASILATEFIRTAVVVSASGIDAFLSKHTPEDFNLEELRL